MQMSNLTVVPPGHWTISPANGSLLRCPYGEMACTGGRGLGDDLCGENFEGLLCGKAISAHHIDWVFQDSLTCSDSWTFTALLLPILIIASMIIFTCCSGNQKSGKAWRYIRAKFPSFVSAETEPTNGLQARLTKFTVGTLHKIKILIFVLPVCSSLPSSLHLPLGLYSSRILQVLSYVSLPSLQALPWDCFAQAGLLPAIRGSDGAPDLLGQMTIATALPLAALIVVGLVYFLHMECLYLTQPRASRVALHRAYTARYGAATLLLLYYALGGIWSITTAVLASPCVDTDPEGVYPGMDLTVMLRDVRVTCGSDSYQTAYLWAVVAALIYMVTIPALQGLLLFSYTKHIYGKQPSRDNTVRALAADQNGEGSQDSDPSESEADDEDEDSDSSDSDLEDGKPFSSAKDSAKDSAKANQRSDAFSTSSSSGSIEAGTASAKGEPSDSAKMAKKRKLPLRTLSKKVSTQLLRTRHLSLYFPGLALLHQDYWADCMYWELYSQMARWFYLAALPSLFPYYHPAQVLVGVAATLLFLQRLLYVRPYADSDNQTLAVCGMLQILLLLFCCVAVQLDLEDSRIGAFPILDAVTCVILLSTPAVYLYLALFKRTPMPLDAAPLVHPGSPRSPQHRHMRRSPPRARPTTPPRPARLSAGGSPTRTPPLRGPPSTPPHSGTASSALSRSPAGSLRYQAHRDLALCTQETVSYDILSALRRRNQQLQWLDHEESEGEEEEFRFGYSSSDSDEEKNDYPGHYGLGRTLLPPSPDSTPPGSGDDHSEDDAQVAKGMPLSLAGPGRAQAQTSLGIPLRLRPAPLNLAHLDGAPAPPRATATPRSVLSPSMVSPRLAPSRSIFATSCVDMPTQEYGAELDCLALSYDHYTCSDASLSDSPSRPRNVSPLVSYAPSAGIFPETGYPEFQQPPVPYQCDPNYALYPPPPPLPTADASGPVAMTMPPRQDGTASVSLPLPPATSTPLSTPRASPARSHSASPAPVVPSAPNSGRLSALRSGVKSMCFGTPRTPPATPSSAAATPRQRSRMLSTLLQDLSPASEGSDDDGRQFGCSAREAALFFDPDAFYTQTEEVAAVADLQADEEWEEEDEDEEGAGSEV